MHPNPAFRQEPDVLNLNLARTRGFGTLCLNGDAVPLVSHVPFLLDDSGTRAEMHLVRSNPIARLVDAPRDAVIVVAGPDGYISPDWYGDPQQVPTWNYVAVHLHGTLSPLPAEALRAHIDAVSAHFEDRLPKPNWTTSKMDPDTLDRMMRQILPFRFDIARVEGTWKLNQNKTEEARMAAAAEIRFSPLGHEVDVLSSLMRGGVREMDKEDGSPYLSPTPNS